MTDPTTAALFGSARRDARSAAWFDGLAGGTLLIRRCAGCGHHSRPDAACCAACRSTELDWVAAAGSGTIAALVRDHRGPEPVDLALVELDEGPWLHTRLVEVAEPAVGAPVVLTVLPPADDDAEHIPAFTSPAGGQMTRSRPAQ